MDTGAKRTGGRTAAVASGTGGPPARAAGAFRSTGKRRIGGGIGLGLRWVRCGWRLYSRNPWLLTGMGLTAATLLVLLATVPLVGGLLVGLIAPVLLAGGYVAVDEVARQQKSVPPGQRLAVLKRSPLGLVRGLHEPERAIALMLVALCCMAGSLALHLAVWLIAGSAWNMAWSSLGVLSLAAVLAALVVAVAGALLLAASLIYALPLALLGEEGLGTAVVLSLRASRYHAAGLAAPLLLGLIPVLVYGATQPYSSFAAPLAGILVAGFLLPLVTTSLYCSYRSLFPEAGGRAR